MDLAPSGKHCFQKKNQTHNRQRAHESYARKIDMYREPSAVHEFV